jgi:hypothetical protein
MKAGAMNMGELMMSEANSSSNESRNRAEPGDQRPREKKSNEQLLISSQSPHMSDEVV